MPDQIEMTNLNDMVFMDEGNSRGRATRPSLSSSIRFDNREPGVSGDELAYIYGYHCSPPGNSGFLDQPDASSDSVATGGPGKSNDVGGEC
jgi:hypothetical protein